MLRVHCSEIAASPRTLENVRWLSHAAGKHQAPPTRSSRTAFYGEIAVNLENIASVLWGKIKATWQSFFSLLSFWVGDELKQNLQVERLFFVKLWAARKVWDHCGVEMQEFYKFTGNTFVSFNVWRLAQLQLRGFCLWELADLLRTPPRV